MYELKNNHICNHISISIRMCQGLGDCLNPQYLTSLRQPTKLMKFKQNLVVQFSTAFLSFLKNKGITFDLKFGKTK